MHVFGPRFCDKNMKCNTGFRYPCSYHFYKPRWTPKVSCPRWCTTPILLRHLGSKKQRVRTRALRWQVHKECSRCMHECIGMNACRYTWMLIYTCTCAHTFAVMRPQACIMYHGVCLPPRITRILGLTCRICRFLQPQSRILSQRECPDAFHRKGYCPGFRSPWTKPRAFEVQRTM